MAEVSGPVIAIALVLCAVFVPTALMAGISGEFFRQFALTIAASTIISAFNSLTLSPALCALLLKPHSPDPAGHGHAQRQALPTLGIAVIGGLIAYVYLTGFAAQLAGYREPRGGRRSRGGRSVVALRGGVRRRRGCRLDREQVGQRGARKILRRFQLGV